MARAVTPSPPAPPRCCLSAQGKIWESIKWLDQMGMDIIESVGAGRGAQSGARRACGAASTW